MDKRRIPLGEVQKNTEKGGGVLKIKFIRKPAGFIEVKEAGASERQWTKALPVRNFLTMPHSRRYLIH